MTFLVIPLVKFNKISIYQEAKMITHTNLYHTAMLFRLSEKAPIVFTYILMAVFCL